MARFARIVVPGLPHHVTQRGNRRAPIFFEDGDQIVYRALLAQEAAKAGVEVWAYCLMPNHVHLILTPHREEDLGRAVGEAHRRYTSFVNKRAGWTGHLFQDRFASVVMDERHLMAATRYVSLNPVRAGLADRAEDWPWSSVGAHLAGRNDGLVRVGPILERVDNFAQLLATDTGLADAGQWNAAYETLRTSERTGRPACDADFLAALEERLERTLALQARGPKRRR